MIVVEHLRGQAVTEQRVEAVERKGRGHPDSICDAIAESIGLALAREYNKRFGAVLHYNIDKSLLAAGQASKHFGGGRITKPMELTLGDRATFRAQGKSIPVNKIAFNVARQWFRDNLRFVDPDEHLKCRSVLAPGSEELSGIFLAPGLKPAGAMRANDTSILAGYYPLSPTEKCVLDLERHLNSAPFKEKYPETGEDVKVMGLRAGSDLSITVAMPLIARFIKSEDGYFNRKEALLYEIRRFLKGFGEHFSGIDVALNALDEHGAGAGGIYLSLLGTSAEDADSGQVGRGNHVNGLISIKRPMSTEAAAGKNCVSHVGKIYNVLAFRIARRIVEEVDGVGEAQVFLLSRIGAPIDTPLLANAQVRPLRGRGVRDFSGAVRRVIEEEFSNISGFCADLAAGKYPVI